MNTDISMLLKPIEIGLRKLTIEDVCRLGKTQSKVSLSSAPEFTQRIEKGAALLEKLLADEGVVYGVNTGYGDSCTTAIPAHLVEELPLHLTRFHGCGLGAYFDDETTLAILLCRLNSLAQGFRVRP